MAHISDETHRTIFEPRGISRRVAKARPYIEYRTAEDICAADPEYATLRGNWLAMIANQSPGLVMVRHAVPMKRDPSIRFDVWQAANPVMAELRPHADEVITDTRRAYHRHPVDDALDYPSWKEHRADPNAVPVHALFGDIIHPPTEDDHLELGSRVCKWIGRHGHLPRGKYIFPPGVMVEESPTRWKQDHRGEWRMLPAKKDPARSRARRLDIHPLAAERLADAEVVYLALEGCLKQDAILTQIMRRHLRASVFGVPGITLWNTDEMRRFAETWLRDVLVVIVPDSDIETNPDVVFQSLFARDRLRAWTGNSRVIVAAPPWNEKWKKGRKEKVGADDFLGRDRGKLEDIETFDRPVPSGLADWKRRHATNDEQGRITRDARVLSWVARFAATPAGRFQVTAEQIARRVHMRPDRVRRAIRSLEELGAVLRVEPERRARNRWGEWEIRPPVRDIATRPLRSPEDRGPLVELLP